MLTRGDCDRLRCIIVEEMTKNNEILKKEIIAEFIAKSVVVCPKCSHDSSLITPDNTGQSNNSAVMSPTIASTDDLPVNAAKHEWNTPLKPASFVVIGDSITGALNRRALYKMTRKDTFIKTSLGAVPSTVEVPNLSKATDIVLHAGSNCSTAYEAICDSIEAKLAELSAAETKPKIYYSSMYHHFDKGDKCGNTDKINVLMDEANNIMKEFCETSDYIYIDNCNIERDDLHDAIHLNEEGARKFGRNIANAVTGMSDEEDNMFFDVKVNKIGERAGYRRRFPQNDAGSPQQQYRAATSSQAPHNVRSAFTHPNPNNFPFPNFPQNNLEMPDINFMRYNMPPHMNPFMFWPFMQPNKNRQ